MTILLQGGLCDGERWDKISEYGRVLWRHPQGNHARYEKSGQTDPATGHPIFHFMPRRDRRDQA